MALGRYFLRLDFNDDGLFNGPGEDVTARLMAPLRWRRGRDYSSQLTGRAVAGRLQAILNNDSGDYSSFNTGSPLSGNLLPGRKVELHRASKFGHYLDFDSLGDKVVVADDAALQNIFDGGGSIEAWVKADSDGEGDFARVLDKAQWFVAVREESGGKVKVRLKVQFSTTDGVWTTTATALTNGTNHHVAITYDADSVANDPIIYIDGVSVAITESTTPVGTRVTDVGDNLFIGNNVNGDRTFDGFIDEVRLWTDIRTVTEIGDNKDQELVGNEAGIAALWHFNEGEGTTTDDAASGDNDGVITGATWTHDILVLWTGFLSSLLPRPEADKANIVMLDAVGPLGFVNQEDVRIAMSTNIATGTAVGNVLDEAGWPAGDRDIDTGQTTMGRFWVERQKTLSALRKIEATEGGYIGESKDGKIVFEDRHRRLKSPHTVGQATFSDAVGAARGYQKIDQEDPLPSIFNIFEAQVQRYTVGALATLWTMAETGADSPEIEPGASKTFFASYPNPASALDAFAVDAWTTPVATTDYTANSASDGSGTNLTSDIGIAVTKFSNAMKITLTNNHASLNAFITALKARGTPVTADDPVRIRSEDSASQTKFGERTYPTPGEFIPDSGEAQDWCDFSLSIYKDPIPILAMRVIGNRDTTNLEEVLTRDIGDRITLVADGLAGLGINEDFFIESMDHVVEANRVHEVTWELSPATAYSGFWVVGSSKLGTETRLAY